ARRAGFARRSRYGVAMGPAVRARIATVLAPPPEAHQRQLAHGRDLHPGQGQVALPVSCGGFFRRDPRLSPLGQAGRGRSKALPEPKRWDGRTIPCRASLAPTVTGRTRLRSCGSRLKALWTKTVGTRRCRT